MKQSIKKTIPFIAAAVFVMAGATLWIANDKGSVELLVQDSREISLTEEESHSLEITLDEVKSHQIVDSIRVIGKAVFDQDAKSFVTPPMSGNVEHVAVKKGDQVKKGDILASIFSQEAAACKIEYQKALNEVALMKNVLETEEALYAKGFSTEQQYLKAKQEYDHAYLSCKYALDQLDRLGMNGIGEEPLSRYFLKAPMDGTIVDHTLTAGALVSPQSDSILIADLNRVHIEIGLNEEEMNKVQAGSFIEVGEHTGIVKSILPAIDHQTMKSYALANLLDGYKLTPGALVDVKIIVNMEEVPVAVKKTSVVEKEGNPVVFIKTEDGFSPTEVVLGIEDDTYVEVVSNLELGEQIADENLFYLKSEMSSHGDE